MDSFYDEDDSVLNVGSDVGLDSSLERSVGQDVPHSSQASSHGMDMLGDSLSTCEALDASSAQHLGDIIESSHTMAPSLDSDVLPLRDVSHDGETRHHSFDRSPSSQGGQNVEQGTKEYLATRSMGLSSSLKPDDVRAFFTKGMKGHDHSGKMFNIVADARRDDLLTDFGKETLKDRYLLPEESFQDLFVRVSRAYGDDEAHAQRLYDYMSRLWFMPATPILSNGGTHRGLPISCFLNESSDSLDGILSLWNENVWLASKGGGIGSYWGNLRSIGESVGGVGKTSGVIPFIHVMDSLTLAISQGSLRRGSAAVYLPVDHPEIEEFIEMRRATGGDPNRKALNLHHGIVLSDDFMRAVDEGGAWTLKSPHNRSVQKTVSARDLWVRILTARVETGEPYFLFQDTCNRAMAPWHKELGLEIKTSNLCSEITLPTGRDHKDRERTAVCCLSSLNLELFEEWKDNDLFIEDIMRFLDNILEDFAERAPASMERAVYSTLRERSVGLGAMGFHAFLQAHNVPFESAMAKSWNLKIFKYIQEHVDRASKTLGEERGPCLDAQERGYRDRFSYKTAIAPNASTSVICGGTSPGIEPTVANSFTHKTLSGSMTIRNKYLARLLEEKGHNDEKTWLDIGMNRGSVQHLSFLSEEEKAVFRTAFEIDQRWIIDLAADRAPLVDQSQSVNLFLPANIHKRILHELHMRAWKKGLKSLYYCRSLSVLRGESSDSFKVAHKLRLEESAQSSNGNDYEECLACQ